MVTKSSSTYAKHNWEITKKYTSIIVTYVIWVFSLSSVNMGHGNSLNHANKIGDKLLG